MTVQRRRAPFRTTAPPSRRRVMSAAAGVILGTFALTGCGAHSAPDSAGAPVRVSGDAPASGFAGDHLDHPLTLTAAAAAATFRSTTGTTTTLADLQKGRLMLVYFGYTHCPDVCPTTMADIAVALRGLPAQIQRATQVVFVTSDPARDTTPVMRAWLANFDAGLTRPFIGLTASPTQIDRVATSMGVPLSPPVMHKDGTISVEHGAQTLAFVRGKASVLWLAGTTPTDYSHDITALTVHGGPL